MITKEIEPVVPQKPAKGRGFPYFMLATGVGLGAAIGTYVGSLDHYSDAHEAGIIQGREEVIQELADSRVVIELPQRLEVGTSDMRVYLEFKEGVSRHHLVLMPRTLRSDGDEDSANTSVNRIISYFAW